MGMEMIASKINSHCHPFNPDFPFIPVYNAAWRYPLNMLAIALDCSNNATRLASCVGPYQLPSSAAYPGKLHDSSRPTKKRSAYNWE